MSEGRQAHHRGGMATRNKHTHSNIIFKSFLLFFITIVKYSCFGEFWVETI